MNGSKCGKKKREEIGRKKKEEKCMNVRLKERKT